MHIHIGFILDTIDDAGFPHAEFLPSSVDIGKSDIGPINATPNQKWVGAEKWGVVCGTKGMASQS